MGGRCSARWREPFREATILFTMGLAKKKQPAQDASYRTRIVQRHRHWKKAKRSIRLTAWSVTESRAEGTGRSLARFLRLRRMSLIVSCNFLKDASFM